MKITSLKVNMFLNAVKGLMNILFPLITFPYVSNILGVNELGRYNFAVSIINYFILLAGLGINAYAVREATEYRYNKRKFNRFADQIFTINLISSGISYFFLILFIIYIPKFQNSSVLLLILSLQIIFRTIGVDWIYTIYEEYLYITVRSILFQIVSLFMLFTLVHSEDDINYYALIMVVSTAGSNIMNFMHSKKFCKFHLTAKIDWIYHIKPIIVLFAMSVTITLYVSSDITILGFLCDDYTVGIYSVSTKIYSVVKAILSSVLVVSVPRLASLSGKNNTAEFTNTAKEIYQILILILVPSICGLVTLRRQVVLILSNKNYITATSSLALLSIALLFCLGAWFWGQCILIPLKQENTVFKATVISAVLNIILNFILIPIWKENAAALTTVIAEAFSFFLCRTTGMKYIDLKIDIKYWLKILIGSSGIFALSYILLPFSNNNWLYVFLVFSCSVLIYLLIEILLKNEMVTSFRLMVRGKKRD